MASMYSFFRFDHSGHDVHGAIRRASRLTAPAPILFFLSACSGGGSGVTTPSPSIPTPASFTNFAAVQANVPTVISGITREGSVAIDPTGAVLQKDVTTPSEGTGSTTFTLNGARQITAIQISGAQSNATFNATNSNQTTLYLGTSPVAVAISNASGSDQAIIADPYVLGFSYQNFGVWGTGLVSGATGKFGVMSVGAKTASSAIPTTGSVTYRGVAGGIYTIGAQYRYAANATFVANFANRTVDFSTSNQSITSVLAGTTLPVSYLSIAGTMTYGAGSSTFSGNLTANGVTPLSPLSGTGSGTYYGPTANEIGGTFFLRGSTTTLIGGFGAKQ